MKKNVFIRILIIALVAMSIMAVAIPAMAASTKVGAVNIRKTPSTKGALVGQVAKGTTFDVDAEVVGQMHNGSNIWLKISNIKCASGSKHNITGKSGYVHSSYVSGYTVTSQSYSGESPAAPSGSKVAGFINGKNVRIRSNATTNSSIVKTVSNIPIVYYSGSVKGVNGDTHRWYKVTSPYEGYVATDYVQSGCNRGGAIDKYFFCPKCGAQMSEKDHIIAITYVNTGKSTSTGTIGKNYYPATARYSYKCWKCNYTESIVDGPKVQGGIYTEDYTLYKTSKPELFHEYLAK